MPTINGTSGGDTLTGGAGDDIIAGLGGADTINGGDGNDTLYSDALSPPWNIPWNTNPYTAPVLDVGSEADTLNGGNGQDTIYAGYGDSVSGGADTDSLLISFRGATSGVTADFRPLLADGSGSIMVGGALIQGIERVLWIEGSNFDDTLYAQAEPFGWADFTPIFGLGGNDHIVAGQLSGNLYGGDGDDIVDGSLSIYGKYYYGGAGNDTVFGGRGWAYGDDGNDIIWSSARAFGGAGDDELHAQWAGSPVYLQGEAGNDTLYGSEQGDYLSGGSGGDTIYGGAGNDALSSSGDGVFDTGTEHDHLEGGAGDDSLSIGYGDDADGGDGTDTLNIWTGGATSGIDVDLINSPSGFTIGGGVIKNIENLSAFSGTAFADHITIGGFGDGVLVAGGGGDDTLTATNGGVYFLGGLGNDTLTGGSSNDALQGDDGNDIISGGGGSDSIHGGNGDDLLEGGDGDDQIWGREDNSPDGIDTVTYEHANGSVAVNLSMALSSATGAAGLDYLYYIDNVIGSAFNDTLTGSFGVNVLDGGAGDDSLDGREGADQLRGGLGNDTYYADAADTLTELAGEGTDTVISAGSFALGANFERLTLSGTDSVDATGNALDNIIIGNSGNNVIDGAAGADAMTGGAGDDTYVVDQAGDTVSENPGEGTDLVLSAATFTLGANVENLTLTGASAINGTGNGLDNILHGNGAANSLSGLAGNDLLDGGAGADVLTGGLGDDVYYIDDAGDLAVEATGEGTDQVYSSITYTLAANLEQLTLLGSAAINGTGNGLANVIVGNSGNNVLSGLAGDDVLNGQGGTDTMLGGLGSDTFYVDTAADQVTEAAGEGADTVIASTSYTLAAGTEIEVLKAADPAAFDPINLTGNGFAQQILGNAGANQLNGGGGNDSLNAYAGDDTLDGGSGADLMQGGIGNDHYYVDDAGDVVTEDAVMGIDYVHAQIGTYTLTDNVEGLIFVNNVVTLGTGNDLQNWITGPTTAAATIYGLGGNDEIHTGSGADTIDGGTGADWMVGGAGNDTYYVDDQADVTVEDSGGGVDQVFASISYGLFGEVENLTLTGTAAIDGTGNGSANVIQGNSAANVLTAWGGADTLSGQGGDDWLDGGDGNDSLDGGTGIDTASYASANAGVTVSLAVAGAQNTVGSGNDTLANIENLSGSEFNDTLTGGAGANILSGLGGDDKLDGGLGDDTLDGGTGSDTASYAAATAAVSLNLTLAGAQNTGAAGNDTLISIENLIGSAFNDTLTGDSGNNLLLGGAGNDALNGGAGMDTASYAGAASGVTVNLTLATAQNTVGGGTDTLSNIENLLGSAFGDTLTGDGNANIIEGGAGNDTLNGGAGTDTASYAGAASGVTVSLGLATAQNTLGAGSDTLSNFENLIGSAFNDTLTGNASANVLEGGAGNDTLNGGIGSDTASYASAASGVTVSLAIAGAQNTGGAGNDTLTAMENLTGSAFGDTLSGDGNANILNGGAGDDVLGGGAGIDTLTGGSGNNSFQGSASALNGDTITDFKVGDAIVITDATLAGFTFNLTGNTLTYSGGTLTLQGSPAGNLVATAAAGGGVQLLFAAATEGNDTITGTEQADDLSGLGGNDTLNGLGGNDILHGDAGDDLLNGGAGNDILHGDAGDDLLNGGAGSDTMTGGSGNDSFQGTGSGLSGDTITDFTAGDTIVITDATLAGFTFNLTGNTLTYTGGSLTFAGPLTGQLAATAAPGGGVQLTLQTDDTITGTEQPDFLDGQGGNDTVNGLGGNDLLVGGDGADQVNGGNGDDQIGGGHFTGDFYYNGIAQDHGLDHDVLSGGDGNDYIWAGYGDDVDGGNGADSLIYSFGGLGSGVIVNTADIIANQPTQFAGGTIQNVEYLIQVEGTDFADTFTVATQNAYLDVFAGDGDDLVIAQNSFVEMIGGAGNDRFVSGSQGDSFYGGAGIDTIDYQNAASGVSVTLGNPGATGNGSDGDTMVDVENAWGSEFGDTLTGGSGDNLLKGMAGNDSLFGNGGNDVLEGGVGDDTVNGGDGFDTASYAGAASAVTINLALFGAQNTLGAGTDTLIDIENAAGSAFNDTLLGNAGANTLSGLAGNDVLDGGAGADTLIGGLGDDRFYIDNSLDTIVEAAGEGDDIAFVLGTYTIAQGVSVETLVALNQASTDPLVLTGNEYGQSLYGNLGDNYLNGGQGADYLVGLDGNDNLLGGTGADSLQGGLGNDVYYVDDSGDQIFENAGEGNDLVVATASYTLAAGASIETMSAEQTTAAINLTGNELAQSLYGNAGNNILTGGGGADFMVGGAGNDKYYVDTQDFIQEDIGGGDDWIFVATSYTLREGNEIETLVAVNQDSLAPVNFTGNEFGQSLYGSQGANQLDGGAGNDYLVGLGGNDFLIGGAGNDNLAGGQGNDLYYVDSGDQIFETAGEGDDLVVAFASFALGAGQSIETLSAAEGGAAINLTGNELGQSIYGNAGANVLTSGGGADYMVGGAGNDIFVLTNAPGVSTVGDYGAGDVVDITQYLSVANGTDVVGGGYVRITAAGQLQVDANGGGDSYVTLSNVNGSGAVTIRYQSGGNATDLSVSRSASQSVMMSAVVAAAGLVAMPVAAQPPETGAGHPTGSAMAVPASAIDGALDLVPVSDTSRLSLAHETRVAIDDSGSLTSILGTDAPIAPDAHPVALHGAELPPAFLAATDVPAQAATVSLLAAPAIVMPAGEQLQALGSEDSASVDGAQHNALVSQVLFDALAGGTGGGTLDALLDTLPGAATGIDHAAPLAAGFAAGPGPAFGADSPFQAAFALDALVLHHDAPPAAG